MENCFGMCNIFLKGEFRSDEKSYNLRIGWNENTEFRGKYVYEN
jgi:hypothetical protein